MKIGIDARLWNESGVGRYLRNLVEWLGKIDKKNEYVIFLRREELLKLPALPAGRQAKKVLANVHWHTLEEQFLLPKIIEKENLDLVHFPYFSMPIFYEGSFVVTIHDLILTHFPTGQASTLPYPLYLLKQLGYRFVIDRAIRNARRVIVPSEATKKEVLDHFAVPEEKIAVTYEGVDKKIKYEKTGQSLNLSKGLSWKMNQRAILPREYFLYVGNAYPHKNLERLLEAFQLTINNLPRGEARRGQQLTTCPVARLVGVSNLKLVFVGKEDFFYKRLKKRVKEMGLSNKVIFYGRANDEELGWLYQNALALVLPSLMEGFGLPALEAMSYGCLVLASDIPALKEVCGKAAVYFKPDDIKDMVDKMVDVAVNYDSELYQRKVKSGLERAKMFSWKKMAEETLKIYQAVTTDA